MSPFCSYSYQDTFWTYIMASWKCHIPSKKDVFKADVISHLATGEIPMTTPKSSGWRLALLECRLSKSLSLRPRLTWSNPPRLYLGCSTPGVHGTCKNLWKQSSMHIPSCYKYNWTSGWWKDDGDSRWPYWLWHLVSHPFTWWCGWVWQGLGALTRVNFYRYMISIRKIDLYIIPSTFDC